VFTRIVECSVRTEKQEELRNKLRSEVVPILQKQSGFVDEISLVSDRDPERMVAISFWRNKEDAERYNRETFPRILDSIKPLLKTTPKVETYNVEDSTVHRIAAGKAAA